MADKNNEAIRLLTPDPSRIPGFFENTWGPILGGVMGFGFAITSNFIMRRPVMSGIQKHVIYTAIGVGIGQILEKNQADSFAERDAVLRRYIELHPEDFVFPERQKYAEIFSPWVPVR